MKKTIIQPHQSSLGMDANIASLVIFVAMAVVSWIPYLGWLAWAVPLVFFFMEKNSKFVKFQAVQALVIGIISAAIAVVLQLLIWISRPKDWIGALNYALGGGGIWVFFGTLSTIILVAISIVIVYLAFMAFSYKQVELPVIGPIAAKVSGKLETMNVNQTGDTENKSDSDHQP